MILAVLTDAHRSLLEPDSCGGRAPYKLCDSSHYCPFCEDSGHDHVCDTCSGIRCGRLVLHDPRDPRVGRRGLACAADAVATVLGWPDQMQSPDWCLWHDDDAGAEIGLIGDDAVQRTWTAAALPALAAYTDRVRAGVDAALLAECVGCVLVSLGIAERIEVTS
jgi:hypothetical protein